MRQGQQNRRGRGRHNNNNSSNNNNHHRKGHQNPLTRSFESNGPDVKIRGTPAHIAEKYISLARDAQSAGDPVLAESYLQHAEHYNRIIMAYREQQIQQQAEMANGGRHRPPASSEMGESADEFSEDDGDDLVPEMQVAQADLPVRGFEPQPRVFDPQPQSEEGAAPPQMPAMREGRDPRDQQHRQHPRDRFGDRDQHRRGPPRDRFGRDRDRGPFVNGDRGQRDAGGGEGYAPRGEREPRMDRDMRGDRAGRNDMPREMRPEPREPIDAPRVEREPRGEREPRDERPQRRRDQFGQAHEQPEFLRRPVRRTKREAAGGEDEGAAIRDEAGNDEKSTI